MIRVDLSKVETLEDFNKKIIEEQENAHNIGYCEIHNAIRKYLSPGNSYTEFGVNQGGTASTAILCNPKQVTLVDIDLSNYRKYLAKIAEKYCKEYGIDLFVKEESTIIHKMKSRTDVLVIDTLHRYDHLEKELELHSSRVNNYIIAHDTSLINGKKNDSLFRCLSDFCDKEKKWKIVERNIVNVGYTVLARCG